MSSSDWGATVMCSPEIRVELTVIWFFLNWGSHQHLNHRKKMKTPTLCMHQTLKYPIGECTCMWVKKTID